MNNHTVGWKFWQQGGVEWNDHLALYGMAKKVKLLTVHTMAASQEIYLLKLNDINDWHDADIVQEWLHDTCEIKYMFKALVVALSKKELKGRNI